MTDKETACLECGKSKTTKWTISSVGNVSIVHLCKEHSKSIEALVKRAKVESPTTIRRKPKIQPLDWTPPEKGQNK